MRIARQLFQEKYQPPKEISKCSTGALLDAAPLYHAVNSGIPLFLPIGNKLLKSIENICFHEANALGFDAIDMAQMIPTSLLTLGEDIHDGFLDQFVFLNGRMKGHHLLSTPEPLLLHLLKIGLQTYRQLPIQIIFSAKFYRQLSEVRGILKTREFKMLAGMHLLDCSEKSDNSIGLFNQYMQRLSHVFGIELKCHFEPKKRFYEYFYVHPEGEEQYNNHPAISIAMAYEYGRDKKVKTRYRNSSNHNANARFITFGLGLQRLLFILLDHYRDERGFNFPASIRPFDMAIIPARDKDLTQALLLADQQNLPHDRLLIDDRYRTRVEQKTSLADFLGIPTKIIVNQHGYDIQLRPLQHSIHTSVLGGYTRFAHLTHPTSEAP